MAGSHPTTSKRDSRAMPWPSTTIPLAAKPLAVPTARWPLDRTMNGAQNPAPSHNLESQSASHASSWPSAAAARSSRARLSSSTSRASEKSCWGRGEDLVCMAFVRGASVLHARGPPRQYFCDANSGNLLATGSKPTPALPARTQRAKIPIPLPLPARADARPLARPCSSSPAPSRRLRAPGSRLRPSPPYPRCASRRRALRARRSPRAVAGLPRGCWGRIRPGLAVAGSRCAPSGRGHMHFLVDEGRLPL